MIRTDPEIREDRQEPLQEMKVLREISDADEVGDLWSLPTKKRFIVDLSVPWR